MTHMDIDVEAVRRWIDDDPDEATARELTDLLEQSAISEDARIELADRFKGLLEFGTAGLRGHLGGGPNRMNRAVVIRAAAGLMEVLKRHAGPDFSIVIGCDARYGSRQFALDTAGVATAAGGTAYVLPLAMPTPLTAFALRHLEADAAVMVTASHNPAEDNGYKVYLGGRVVTDSGQGSQIVPPFDAEIFEAIQAVTSVRDVPRAQSGWHELDDSIVEAYLDRVTSLVTGGPENAQLRIVLTSMHGVGGATMSEALRRRGFSDVHVVAQQQDPDPDFPTVRFPNPEEPGALDLAMQLARDVNADIILANDPDADRCSAALPDPSIEGGWRQLTGDQVGALLGLRAVTQARGGEGNPTVANSIVSSRLLSRIAQTHGVTHRVTLTGFKWISRVPNLVFGYEEALGYCVDPGYVRDKDGISACLQLARFAAERKADGSSLRAVLDELACEFGLYATSPLTIRVDDLATITTGMANLRERGVDSLAGSPVIETTDLTNGSEQLDLPGTDALIFRTESDDRVVARPSGTEPKLKCYCEVVIPVSDGDVDAARTQAAERLERVKTDLRAALGV